MWVSNLCVFCHELSFICAVVRFRILMRLCYKLINLFCVLFGIWTTVYPDILLNATKRNTSNRYFTILDSPFLEIFSCQKSLYNKTTIWKLRTKTNHIFFFFLFIVLGRYIFFVYCCCTLCFRSILSLWDLKLIIFDALKFELVFYF